MATPTQWDPSWTFEQMAAAITEVEAASLATFAQGELADSATQPEDLGTAAAQDVAAFATGAEGDLATTATQPEDLGTAAVEDVAAFATAAQGVKADAAAPKASPTFTGDVKIPDANADGEALAYAQDDAVLQGLMVTKSAAPAYTLYELGEAADQGRWRIAVSGSDLYVQQMTDAGVFIKSPMIFSRDGATDLSGSASVLVAALTATGDVKIPDGNADGEALAHSQAGAVLNGLTSTGNIEVVKTFGKLSAQHTGDGTIVALNTTVGKAFFNVNGGAQLIQLVDDDSVNMGGASSVLIPDGNADGEALAHSQAGAVLNGLTSTGDVLMQSSNNQLEVVGTGVSAGGIALNGVNDGRAFVKLTSNGGATWFGVLNYSPVGNYVRWEAGAGSIGLQLANAASVTVPAPSASGQAAQVSAIDAATGRLAIGGKEIGDTGWRKLASWTGGVQGATGQAFTIDLETWTLVGTGSIQIRRIGPNIEVKFPQVAGNSIGPVTADSFGLLSESANYWPDGYRPDSFDTTAFGTDGAVTSKGIRMRSASGVGTPSFSSNTTVGMHRASLSFLTNNAWPTTLPGVAG
jgi:hypothetical protein